jgi:surfeit locus 1 family protein
MIRRLPLIPTIIVALAAAAMIGLGIWQLGRAREKEALIAQYRAGQDQPPIAYPTMVGEELPLFRYATGVCLRPVTRRSTAGRNRTGETGYVHIVECSTGAEGPGMAVEVGWSKDPRAPIRWAGGPVSGIIAPDKRMRMRLVAATAAPGLQPSAPPSIESIPNNHRMYAVQWFLFAVIAVVIYLLAVRKRLNGPVPRP